MSAERVLCVVGPTAVGKSAVAEEVALRLGGEVVSVDSMQVYRGMDIGTAKSPKEARRCPLHMVDIADANETYSVARFQKEARSCIEALHRQGKEAVLCGGTGLYLDSVIDDMSFPQGETCGSSRAAYELYATQHGPKALHELLGSKDPQSAAAIHPNNVRRVVRALEMLEQGTSYAEHHKGLKNRAAYYQARIWALSLPRETLYRRIDNRVEQMFSEGLVDEVSLLMENGIMESATASKAIGYKEVIQALNGKISIDEAKSLIKRNTRHYAKRQLSWLRRDARASWIDMSQMDVFMAAQHICEDWGRFDL